MNYYKIYGKRMISDYELPQLVKQTEEEKLLPQDITIKAGVFPEELKLDKPCWSEIKKPVSLLSNFTCWLYVTADEIIYELKKDTKTPQYLNSYLLGWGLSMLFWERNEPAIHCSCVYNEKGAVIISGNSGCGKSTVTAHFLDHGYGLVADDISVVQLREDGAYATPCFPAQKFCRDVVTARNLNTDDLIYINEEKDKFLVPYEGDFPSEPIKIRCMIVLGKAAVDAPVLDEPTGLGKFLTCLNSLFLKPLLRQDLNAQENATPMLKMASYFPVYTLVRPEEGDTKKEVLELLNTLM
ncbi:MAG: hypothetical protein MJ124_08670 [Lachnospiraceae bacterium]|nr:hypothetical protein [Lachnospiraceae bacterium]